MLVTQLCPTLFDHVDCSPPGSSVHGIFQTWILAWFANSFSRGSSWPKDWTWVSCTTRKILYWLKGKPQKVEIWAKIHFLVFFQSRPKVQVTKICFFAVVFSNHLEGSNQLTQERATFSRDHQSNRSILYLPVWSCILQQWRLFHPQESFWSKIHIYHRARPPDEESSSFSFAQKCCLFWP